jgi:hypothetical protein
MAGFRRLGSRNVPAVIPGDKARAKVGDIVLATKALSKAYRNIELTQ